ncbi:MAG: aminotransferase class I/II-fold pyridoxal phosphate-dependent enzyme [Myxococcaceae bacterium]
MGDVFDKCGTWKDYRIAQAAGLYPYHHATEASHASTEADIEGRRVLVACSSNYLGLAGDPRVKEAAANALRKFGASTSGPRLQNGTLSLHEELEGKLAEFLGCEDAIVTSAGSLSNVAVLSALVGRNDVVLSDAQNHPSISDGVRLSFGGERRFRHRDAEHLDSLFAGIAEEEGRLVATDGVFQHEGDLADLPKLVEQARKHQSRILLHDSHGIGVLGEKGRGTAEHFGLEREVDLLTFSLATAFGAHGGVIAGAEEVTQFLRHKARAIVFTSSLPASSAAAALKSLETLKEEPQRRTRLLDIAEKMHQGLRSIGFDTGVSVTPIVPVLVGDQAKCFRFWKALFEEGILTTPIVPPMVAAGHSLLRLSFIATHSDEQLDRMLSVFEKVGKRMGLLETSRPPAYPKVEIARPGTFVVGAQPSPRWAGQTHSTAEDRAAALEQLGQLSSRELAGKLFDVVENLTWRAANLQPDDLKRLSSAPLRLWSRRSELSDLLLEKSASLLLKTDEPEK